MVQWAQHRNSPRALNGSQLPKQTDASNNLLQKAIDLLDLNNHLSGSQPPAPPNSPTLLDTSSDNRDPKDQVPEIKNGSQIPIIKEQMGGKKEESPSKKPRTE